MVSIEGSKNGQKIFRTVKPYAAMILLQFSFAVMYVTLSATLKKGMNQSVLLVYRNIFAAVVMTPFALWFERKERPKITAVVFLKIIALTILQPVLDQNFYSLGVKETSAGFASSLENINPAITFVICLLLGVEKVKLRQRNSQAKVLGSILAVSGAVLMILYRGPIVQFFWVRHREAHSTAANADGEAAGSLKWIEGTAMILLSTLSWCSFLILQSHTLKSYPAKITLSIYVSCMGSIANLAIFFTVNRGNFKAWMLGWDMRLFLVFYSGAVCTAATYVILGMVMKEKGPVFASAFSPLSMIMTIVLSSIALAEKTNLGTLIGGFILVAGLYSLLWGHSKDPVISSKDGGSIEGGILPIVSSRHVENGSIELRVTADGVVNK